MFKFINDYKSKVTIENPRGRKLVPYIVLFLCLLGTVYVWYASSIYLKKIAGERFAIRADEITDRIVQRIQSNRTILRGGRIWIESEVGKGSRFVFVIPLRQGQGSSSMGQG